MLKAAFGNSILLYNSDSTEVATLTHLGRTKLICDTDFNATGGIFQFHSLIDLSGLNIEQLETFYYCFKDSKTIRVRLSKYEKNIFEMKSPLGSLFQDYLYFYKKNLINLKMLIDTCDGDELVLKKIDRTSRILNFNEELNLKELADQIMLNYESL